MGFPKKKNKKIMISKRFNHKWIEGIQGCIKNLRYSVFINDRQECLATRGVRQGNPLSTFFFLLVGEVLGTLIENLHQNGFYEGFAVGMDNIHIPMLQFADDTLLFCKYDNMLENLKQTIKLFEWCSDQKVNWDKSTLRGINVEEIDLLSTEALWDEGRSPPLIYLKLPLGGYTKLSSFWHRCLIKSK